MKIGCCIAIDYYDALVAAGYESITLAARDVAAWDEATFEKVRHTIAAGPLSITSLNNFCPPELKLRGKGFSLSVLEAYMRLLADRAAKLGVRYIGIGAAPSRNMDAGDDPTRAVEELGESLRCMCAIAAEHGIDILLESVCAIECNLITTTSEALTLVRELDIPNLHLVYDIYHESVMNQPISVIADAAAEIRVVHLAQRKNDQRYYLFQEETETYQLYWNALEAVGYQGEFCVESFVGDPMEELTTSFEILEHCRNSKCN